MILALFSVSWVTFSVDQTAYDTDVETHEVHEGVLIVPADEHAHVGDEDVFETAHNGGGESRVVSSAEDGGEHQDEAEHTT